jgi:hypothetical protein
VTGNGEPPLYITIILNILSSLGENFTYSAFLRKLDERKATFNPAQLAGLEQRQTLLESFLCVAEPTSSCCLSTSVEYRKEMLITVALLCASREERAEPRGVRCQEARKASRNRKKFAVGQLTIFDLCVSPPCPPFNLSFSRIAQADHRPSSLFLLA